MATLDLFAQLESIKKERNAVILSHYYQDPGIRVILPINPGCACNASPHMRKNTIEKMVMALENMHLEIMLPKNLRLKALTPLKKCWL